jgi:hypothetical protein
MAGRWALGVGIAVAALLVANTATSLGGVVVAGVGMGDTYRNGSLHCKDQVLHIEIIYMPSSNGGPLKFDYLPGAACPGNNGGWYFGGRTQLNPLQHTWSCRGTEATGLFCEATDNLGTYANARVGPYTGPGKPVTFTSFIGYFMAPETYAGSFIAT